MTVISDVQNMAKRSQRTFPQTGAVQAEPEATLEPWAAGPEISNFLLTTRPDWQDLDLKTQLTDHQ